MENLTPSTDTYFEFNRIVVIESLGSEDRLTGKELVRNLRSRLLQLGRETPTVQYIRCATSLDFEHTLKQLEKDASEGNWPVLHIECHGADDQSGLVLADKTFLAWHEFAQAIAPINLASDFNLFVGVSACFGAYLQQTWNPTLACPCWGFVAPTDSVEEQELENGFTAFYDELLVSQNFALALSVLHQRQLSTGHWEGQLAEDMYWDRLRNYIEDCCRIEDADSRMQRLRDKGEKEGFPWEPLWDLKAAARLKNRQMHETFFPIFFQTQQSSAIADRFELFKAEIAQKVSTLARSGRYLM